ncbi:MAG: DNA mismatch repair endonuclease MutL [Cyclobacteriaceae bacterium]
MSDIIQLLPDSIANQIAAGEVVQRPASAVKELMENSIDAKATVIQLIVKEAGKTLIQVIDNGMGMSETDARMSLERHATSKIRKAEDLFTLHTKGFRGEALASIAAVSQMEMRTRHADQELGTCLVVEGSEVKKQEPVACEKGTSISVKNLFYNIPARRNFLKSNPVEMRHVIDEFQRLALAHSEIVFSFLQTDELVYDLPASRLSQRIVNIFGKSYQEQLAACQEETNLVKVNGFVGKPDFARKTRGEQFLFVNNRFIRSNYLHHAVMSAFENLLPENSFPFYVIFMEIDPKHIDVNVHPTKTEIKFDDERAIYAVVRSAVRQAIGSHNLTPAIDFNSDVNIISKLSQAASQSNDIYFEERFSTGLGGPNQEHWEKLFEQSKNFGAPPLMPQVLRFESSVSKPNDQVETPTEEKTLIQLHQRYIMRQVRSGLMILDQQFAHERILYEKFLNQLKNKSAQSQQDLFPQTVSLSAADFALVLEMEQEIAALGFRLEVFGKNTILINGVPTNLSTGGSGKALFEGLIEQFKINQSDLSIPLKENLARSLAKRAGIKAGQTLVKEEMRALIDGLFACATSNYTPDGIPTFFIFELRKIESYFNRQ